MADQRNIQEREFRLYKEIQVKFREVVDPVPLSDCLFELNCLTEDDMDRIRTNFENLGRSKAAGELLDRLRKRPNWVHNLLKVCSRPDIGLEHLCSNIKDEMTKLEIRIMIRRNDEHNYSGVSDTVKEASEEAAIQEGHDTQSTIQQILAEFKSRVDPEDFLQYLRRIKEEDEEAVKCKQQQSGRLAAADELVSRLLRNYKHWKDYLQEALIHPGSGLKDLGEKLSVTEIEIDESNLRKMLENLKSSPANSAREISKKRKLIVQEFVREHSLKVKSMEEVPQVLQMAGYIDAFLLKVEKGSLIITLSLKTIDTLKAIQKLYLGGMLMEAITKDLLSEKRRHHILEIARKNGAKDRDIEEKFFDSVDFDVEICQADLQFCLLKLKDIRDISIPASPFQIVVNFESKRNRRQLHGSDNKSKPDEKSKPDDKRSAEDKTIYDKIDLPLPSIITRLLKDSFLQRRYRQIAPMFFGPLGEACHLFVQWLFNKLQKFVFKHKYGKELLALGVWLGSTFQLPFGEKQERHLFIVENLNRNIKLFTAPEGKFGSFDLKVQAWQKFVKEGIIEFSENHQKYRFQSLVLEHYLIYMSGCPFSSAGINPEMQTMSLKPQRCASFFGFLPVFQLAENPQNLAKTLIEFKDNSSEKMEYLYLHYIVMTYKDPTHRLDVLHTLVRAKKTYVVRLQEKSFEAQIYVLRVLIQEEIINVFETVSGLDDKHLWNFSTEVIKKSIHVRETRSFISLVRLLSFLGIVQVDVVVEKNLLANICFKRPKNGSVDYKGHVSLKFSGISLKSSEDVGTLCAEIQLIPNLHQVNLSGTSNLKPLDYQRILKACRYSSLFSLLLNDTILLNKEDPQPIGLQYLPHLNHLEMEGCSIGDAGIHAMSLDFKNAGQLTVLSVARNKITSTGIIELSGLLMDKENLRIVRVNENDVGYEGAVSLAILFKNLPFLEVVNLCDCKRITDKGFELIIESLKGKNLKKMNVKNCEFSETISEKFFNLLKKMHHFQHLDYGCNPIGPSEFDIRSSWNISELFLEMMSCNKHSWNLLNLWKCNIGYTNVFATSNRLGHLSTLTDLCLQENQLKDRDGACIGEYMEMSWHSLRNLNLRQNNIGDFGAAKIFKGVQKNSNLKTLYLDRNHIGDGNLIKDMAMYFVDEAHINEMDVSYNQVPETETRRFLGDTPANILPCNGYTEISINNRIMRL